MLNHYHAAGIVQCIDNSLKVVVLMKRAGGTRQNTLAAINTAGKVQPFVESGSNMRGAASVYKINGRYLLNLLAHAHALAAQNTFLGIPDDGRAGNVHFVAAAFARVPAAAHPQIGRQFLQLAIIVANAVKAVVRVVGQQQFHNGLA